MKSPHRIYSYLFGIGGLVLIIGVVWYEEEHTTLPEYTKVGLHVLIEIGIALISVALIGILLETKHWSDYFNKKLKNIVIDKDFLHTLNEENVSKLYQNTTAEKFGDQVKDKKSLYEFLTKRTLNDIATPYRENFSLKLEIQKSGTELSYKEVLGYTCCAIKNKYQKHVDWSYTEGELFSPKFISFKKNIEPIDVSAITPDKDGKEIIYHFDLGNNKKDKLDIELISAYTGPIGKLWKVVQNVPVKNISCLEITYPADLFLHFEKFGIENEGYQEIKNNPGYFHVIYDNWLPVSYGFALQISKVP
jgi:hypothetical protein